MSAQSAESVAKLSEARLRQLVDTAAEMKAKAYCPYSNFKVGAALLTKGGHVFTGCNVENSAYGLCMCAERTAIVKAVSEGHREFLAIAVSTDVKDDFGAPCGSCRQVIAEFGVNTLVIMAHSDGSTLSKTIQELLPFGFSKKHLVAGQNAS